MCYLWQMGAISLTLQRNPFIFTPCVFQAFSHSVILRCKKERESIQVCTVNTPDLSVEKAVAEDFLKAEQ